MNSCHIHDHYPRAFGMLIRHAMRNSVEMDEPWFHL
jgi:hypothetical protein